ncbi:hypothetical protein [Hydrococcus rivularis]|nr:hypothetical protein [Hydrococcus rivularis]
MKKSTVFRTCVYLVSTYTNFQVFAIDILLPSPYLGEGLGVRAIDYLCH